MRETDPLLRTHHHHGRRDARERESLDVPIAVDTGEVAALRCLVAHGALDHVAKSTRTLVRHRFRILLRGDDDEVITTNVADEISTAFADDCERRLPNR